MTSTDICNIALAYIAKNRITSLDDNTEEARQCKLFYNHCRKQLLRSYTWGFARKHTVLAKLTDTVRGWLYVYAYPRNCLAVRFVYNKEGAAVKETDREQFEICITTSNVQAICCDIENALMEYTVDVIDSSVFSDDFVEALSRLLSSKIALKLTGNAGVVEQQYKFFELATQQAKVATMFERQKDTIYPDDFISVRG